MEQNENTNISQAEVLPVVQTRKEKREYSAPVVVEFTPAAWARFSSF